MQILQVDRISEEKFDCLTFQAKGDCTKIKEIEEFFRILNGREYTSAQVIPINLREEVYECIIYLDK